MRVLRGVVYMTKRNGPRTEHWGTPQEDVCQEDRSVSHFTRKKRDVRYDLSQLRTEPWIPNHILHDFSRSSQGVVGRMSKVKRITWAKVYRWKQCDYAIAASMTPPFPLFNLYAFGRSRATLLTMTPHREQHQTCSSRSSIKNKCVWTLLFWLVFNFTLLVHRKVMSFYAILTVSANY